MTIVLIAFKNQNVNSDLQNMLEYVAVGALGPILMVSQILYKQQIQKARDADISEEQKLNLYQTANILKGAFIEGGNLFCIVAYMLTGRQWLVIVVVAVLGIFFMQRPSLQKYQMDIGEKL